MRKVILSQRWLWPYLIFIAALGIFFGPPLIQSKIPLPADLIVGAYYPWFDYKWGQAVGVVVKNPILSDAVSLIYPIKALAVNLLNQGQLPLWNFGMFGGYPLWANLQVGLLFPTMLFYFVLAMPWAWTAQVIAQVGISLVTMYWLLRSWKLSSLSAVGGAISYAFSGFAMIWLEWNVLVAASSLFPLLLLSLEKYFQKAQFKWGLVFSLSLAAQIFAGYPQLVVLSGVGLAIDFFCHGWSIKRGIGLAWFGLLGGLLTMAIVYPGLELANLSQRPFEISSNTIFLPWQNLIALVAPDYFGNHSTGNFWGVDEYTLMTIYSGLISLILAVVAIFGQAIPKKNFKFLAILCVVGFLIILPTPIGQTLYSVGAWGKNASSATRAAFLINFSLSALVAFGLNSFEGIHNRVKLQVGLGFLGGLLILGLLTKFGGNLSPQHASIALHNLILPIILVIIYLILIIFSRFKLNKSGLTQIGLIVLLSAELFRFGLKFNSFSKISYLYPPTPTTDFLMNHQNNRFLGSDSVMPSNMWLGYGLESASGYDALYPLTWARFLAVLNSQNSTATPASRFGSINHYNNQLFNLTSTKYLLVLKDRLDQATGSGDISLSQFKVAEAYKSVIVLENSQAFPRSFFVSQILNTPLPSQLQTMLDPKINLRQVGLSEDLNQTFDVPDLAESTYRQITNQHVQVQTNNPSNGFLIITNSFYPGWQALIDGTPTKLYQTDEAFWGVKLPAGKHQLDFIYYPKSLIIGLVFSIVAVVLLILSGLLWPKKGFNGS